MIQWTAFDMRNGTLVASMPTLIVDYPLTRSIGAYDTGAAHLIIDGTEPLSWDIATTPGASILVAWDDEDSDENVIWAGYVNTRTRSAETNTVDLGLVTIEGYLDRRYINDDLSFSQVDAMTIVTNLLNSYVFANGGLTFGGLTQTSTATIVIDYLINDADNMTVYEALQALSQMLGGPEWKVEWLWADSSHTSLMPMVYVGTRVGVAAPVTGSPDATFEMPGCLTSAVWTEDFSSDKGATLVEAYSSAGGINPSGYFAGTASAVARPIFEFRFEPPGADNGTKLTSAAKRVANRMINGTSTIALVADRRTAPRYGREWLIGDDIGYVIGGPDENDNDTVPTFPGGKSGVLRAIGVEFSDDVIVPVIANLDPTQ